MKMIKGFLSAILLVFMVSSSHGAAWGATVQRQAPEAPMDPLTHYADTGEWVPPEKRQTGIAALREEDVYEDSEEYSQEDEEAMRRSLEEAEAIREWESYDAMIKLRKYDELAFDAYKDYDEAKSVPAPFASAQGYIMFPYGAVVPRIACRPYRVTDIALEPGESIMGIHAGDTVRWLFSPSQSMQDGAEVSHIVVKPTMPNISTNLMVHTDRRSYQIDLVSSEAGQYTTGVAFTYPNTDLNAKFVKPRKKDEDPRRLNPDVGGNINSGYTVKTRSTMLDWKPLAVFDDGKKTYIKMPLRITEAPVLYIRLDGKDSLVNYRIKDRFYVVDRIFDTAVMKLGARTVVIKRNEPIARQNSFREEIEKIDLGK